MSSRWARSSSSRSRSRSYSAFASGLTWPSDSCRRSSRSRARSAAPPGRRRRPAPRPPPRGGGAHRPGSTRSSRARPRRRPPARRPRPPRGGARPRAREPPQLGGQLAGARRAGVDARPQRRLDPRGGIGRVRERRDEARGGVEQPRDVPGSDLRLAAARPAPARRAAVLGVPRRRLGGGEPREGLAGGCPEPPGVLVAAGRRRAAQARELGLGRVGPGRCGQRLAPQGRLRIGELSERHRRGERRVQPARTRDGLEQRRIEPLGARDQPPEHRRGRPWPPQVGRQLGVGALRIGLRPLRELGVRGRAFASAVEPGRLDLELPAPRLELELHRLRGLAREPQLAAGRVVAEALLGHRRDARGEQRVLGDDRKLADEVARDRGRSAPAARRAPTPPPARRARAPSSRRGRPPRRPAGRARPRRRAPGRARRRRAAARAARPPRPARVRPAASPRARPAPGRAPQDVAMPQFRVGAA